MQEGSRGGREVNTFSFSQAVLLPDDQRGEGDLQAELGGRGAAHPDGRLGHTGMNLVLVLGQSLQGRAARLIINHFCLCGLSIGPTRTRRVETLLLFMFPGPGQPVRLQC